VVEYFRSTTASSSRHRLEPVSTFRPPNVQTPQVVAHAILRATSPLLGTRGLAFARHLRRTSTVVPSDRSGPTSIFASPSSASPSSTSTQSDNSKVHLDQNEEVEGDGICSSPLNCERDASVSGVHGHKLPPGNCVRSTSILGGLRLKTDWKSRRGRERAELWRRTRSKDRPH
jgi:hypothetical protein